LLGLSLEPTKLRYLLCCLKNSLCLSGFCYHWFDYLSLDIATDVPSASCRGLYRLPRLVETCRGFRVNTFFLLGVSSRPLFLPLAVFCVCLLLIKPTTSIYKGDIPFVFILRVRKKSAFFSSFEVMIYKNTLSLAMGTSNLEWYPQALAVLACNIFCILLRFTKLS